MAYENYSSVAWSSGTPLTGDRLQQMSTNIQQVKEATDDKPQGIIKYNSISSSISAFTDINATENLLIALRDDTGSGGNDYRISSGANRFIRLTLTFPGISIRARGAENTRYVLSIKQGTDTSNIVSTLATYYFSPPVYSFIDVSSDAAATDQTVRANGAVSGTYIGAGQYSVIVDSTSSGLSTESYFVSVKREVNSTNTMTNAPAYTVMTGSGAPLEFYAEDVGGT